MKQLKIKDFVRIALLTALYFIFYALTMAITMPFGPFAHAISPGFAGLLSGAVIFFTSRKVGKMWQYTIMIAIMMLAFTLMGGGYWIWTLTSMVMAIIADLIVGGNKEASVLKVAIASGLMHVGQAWGSIVPSWLFLEKYRADWIARGQTPEAMDAMIKYTAGAMGVLSTVITFILAFIGVYIGYFILKKHLEKKPDPAENTDASIS